MNSLRNKLSNRKLMQNGFAQLQSYSSTASTTNIQVPNRKERGPTDILMALESTIKRDPTAAHYKFIDDPYLIPASNNDKRSFALSREAGRKAAMWIRQEHAEFFDHKIAEPFIESYAPRAVYTEKSQVSEEILLNSIKSGYVTDSITIFNLLDRNVKIETKLALFELLCFYNSTDPINKEYVEERWFSFNRDIKHDSSYWTECSDKIHLFKCLKEEKGEMEVAAYNTIITGLAKHNSLLKAWDLYEECLEKNIPLMKRTYDHLIKAIVVTKHMDNDRIILLKSIYKQMVEKNLRPDVKTLNASLQMLSMFKMAQRKNIVSTIFNEFKNINVKPSLGSYYHILKCFYKRNNQLESVLNEILNVLEDEKSLEVQCPEDKLFFHIAMQSAYHARSLILAKRIHDLLIKDNNYSFLSDNYQEGIYYKHYLLLHLEALTFQSFMEIYEEMTPNIYTPDQDLFKEILSVMKETEPSIITDALQIVCSQGILLDYVKNDEILDQILDLLVNHCKPSIDDSPLNKIFAKNAWTFWTDSQDYKLKSDKGYTCEASVLEKIAVLCLRGEEFDQMLEVLSTLVNNKTMVLGSMTAEAMKEIFDACLTNGHCEAVLSLIEYAVEFGMDEGTAMGLRAYKTLSLSVAQENRLQALVGKDIRKLQAYENKSS
ncbi:protein PTCD3 homolog, mitochondrial [Leptopilina heterotoma]|uniref:protein PTCD3 homolog, mitochondrial n=1 Tax=Leptopilina heterotoma TaxID=63436 RepID=UPI001CA91E3C|nr:protein PTCD3 homolog, mitochondrial [Leptopilina heterotoma]